jgi:hypothetical protein
MRSTEYPNTCSMLLCPPPTRKALAPWPSPGVLRSGAGPAIGASHRGRVHFARVSAQSVTASLETEDHRLKRRQFVGPAVGTHNDRSTSAGAGGRSRALDHEGMHVVTIPPVELAGVRSPGWASGAGSGDGGAHSAVPVGVCAQACRCEPSAATTCRKGSSVPPRMQAKPPRRGGWS